MEQENVRQEDVRQEDVRQENVRQEDARQENVRKGSIRQKMRRHMLLSMSEEGKQQAIASVSPKDSEELLFLWKRYPQVPVICARQSGHAPKGWLEGGISFPERMGETRVRFAVTVSQREILSAVTPWQMFTMFMETQTEFVREKKYLKRLESEDLKIGLFGSAALQQYTGLPYIHKDSDFDLVIKAGGKEAVKRFWSGVKAAEIAVDAELLLKNGWYVKAAELFSGSGTVLAKNESEAALLPSREVWKTIEQTDEINY